MAPYFPEAENSKWLSNTDMCSDVTEPSTVAARETCLSFGSISRSRTFTISPTTSTIGRHLGFESGPRFLPKYCSVFLVKTLLQSQCLSSLRCNSFGTKPSFGLASHPGERKNTVGRVLRGSEL